ncbi:PorP/SprF family type IX secretion system membrane protein [Cyclobacteriaceae bacterium]|nr:PorP/SprF family type IX secretion system membrane protein [Cyclobacteriaceae bacterium]
MKKGIFTLVLLVVSLLSTAQTEPVYTQYMFNPVVINPAYVGLHDMTSLYLVHRNQWRDFDNDVNPMTTTLSGQTTIPKNNIGLGFSYVNDRVPVQTTNEFNVMGSYKIPFGSKSLSFGVQVGVMTAKYDYDHFKKDPDYIDDVYFSGEGKGDGVSPTLGAGVLWSSRKIFVGLSVPRLLEMKFDDGFGNGDVDVRSRIERNVLVTGGYVFHLDSRMKIKPSVLLKYTEGGFLSYDINTSVLFQENIWVGASLRSSDIANFNSMSLMAQLKLSQLFVVGTAYEFPVDSKSVSQIGHTFELMLNFNFTVFDKQAVQTIFY